MAAKSRRAAVCFVASTLAACGAENDAASLSACAGDGARSTLREPLFHASDSAPYLAPSEAERAAIGRLEAPGNAVVCTATRIAPYWLLAARHCEISGKLRFQSDGAPGDVLEWVRHPELDVALARVSPDPCAMEGAAPATVLPIVEPEPEPSPAPSRATLAGYGLTEERSMGDLEFLVEAVVARDDTSVTVGGFGRSGACSGDSGGPLLIRDRHGRVAVLGVLSRGDSTCDGEDIYVRVDSLLEWIGAHVELPLVANGCGEIDERGRCVEGRAVWCENGGIVSESCEGETTCGFDSGAGAYRCSAAPLCAGDSFGSCAAGTASRCTPEGPSSEPCGEAGLVCGYDPVTGQAACRSAPLD